MHSTYYWNDFNRFLIDVWTDSTINIKSNFQNRYDAITKLYGLPTELNSSHGMEVVSWHHPVETLNTGTALTLIWLAVPTGMKNIAWEIHLSTKLQTVIKHSAHAQLWAWADLCKIESRNSEAIWLATCSGDIFPKACELLLIVILSCHY